MKNVFAIASVLSRISSTLSMSSITANISNSFFCSSFETNRIIPEVCCITKAAIKNVHFCTELSKVAALVATSGVTRGGGKEGVCPGAQHFGGAKLRPRCYVLITKCRMSADANSYNLQNAKYHWEISSRFAK